METRTVPAIATLVLPRQSRKINVGRGRITCVVKHPHRRPTRVSAPSYRKPIGRYPNPMPHAPPNCCRTDRRISFDLHPRGRDNAKHRHVAACLPGERTIRRLPALAHDHYVPVGQIFPVPKPNAA